MENEYLDLPDDPEEAFATLHRRKFSELEADWIESDGRSNYLHCARKYVDIMIVFDEVYNLDILENLKLVPQNENQFSEFFEVFRRHVNMFSEKVLMESARRKRLVWKHLSCSMRLGGLQFTVLFSRLGNASKQQT